jgi:DNA polymerase/3'-5' exonuclease PolX
MKVAIIGSGGNTYDVDTEALKCSCPRFKFHCKNFGVNEPERLCKHLIQALKENPPSHVFIEGGVTIDPDGKTRYPREKFEPYVVMIEHMMDAFSSLIIKNEICGSWRRGAERVSDLDVLLVMKDVESFRQFQDYIESMYAPTIRWKGDAKATYVFDEFCQVDFKIVSEKHWPFATLHFTGSKLENIRLRKVAVTMGYSLSEYGLCDNLSMDGGYDQFEIKTEEGVYKFLNQKYKNPSER